MKLTFEVNNGQTLVMEQFEPGERVFVFTQNANGFVDGKTVAVWPDTFVMLWNLYRYIKDNDIHNDFINPNGKRKEV